MIHFYIHKEMFAKAGTALLDRPVDRQRRTCSQRQHDVGLWQHGLTVRPRAPVPEWTKLRAGGKLPVRVALDLARGGYSWVAGQTLSCPGLWHWRRCFGFDGAMRRYRQPGTEEIKPPI